MGGGDLNLKKSWHPSTLRNIERVWKAEQKHEVEKQKIEQLQKELAEERAREEIQAYAEDQGVVKKREERLDWMYQGPAAMVNREDYLMGRKVDRTLELLQQEETGVPSKNDDEGVGSSMFSSQDLTGTATVDLANKIREDPLFSIMKKEKEQRKNLLSNPVKMKQLQKMLKKSLGSEKESSKRHSDADRKHKKHKKERRPFSDEPTSKRYENDRHTKSKVSSPSDKDRHRRRSPSYENTHDRRHLTSSSSENRHHLTLDRRHRNSSHRSHASNSRQTDDRCNALRLDEEERASRLREMQENAKWREEQRAKKVRRYREDDKREEKAAKVDASDFIKPMLARAAGKGSLENRVKQKMFSIQRGSADMDQHFARRK